MMHQINLPLINNHIFWIMILLPFQFNFFCWALISILLKNDQISHIPLFLAATTHLPHFGADTLIKTVHCWKMLPSAWNLKGTILSYCEKDILHWKFGNLKLLISELYYCIDFNFWKRAIRHLFSCHWALFYGNFMMNKNDNRILYINV